MKVRWTQLARSDLDEARQYISEHNPGAALKVGARIHAAARRLETHPYLGGWVPFPGHVRS